MSTIKGFIKNWKGEVLLPITRGELILDSYGNLALNSEEFLAGGKDGKGNLPGLITAAERAMLSGGANGEGISDIYNKLDLINQGLVVKTKTLNFYKADGSASPINIIEATDAPISIVNGENNVVAFGLKEINTETTVSQILRNIKVDKWGRVVEVSGGDLLDSDIPKTLTDKIIKESVIDACLTADKAIAENDLAIVNKAYVDTKFNSVNAIATGALKFDGTLSTAAAAIECVNNKNYWNCYYKVNGEYTIEATYMYAEPGTTAQDQTVKPGDTLIVYPNESKTSAKLVYVPSGDEPITSIEVYKVGETAVIDNKTGKISFKFEGPFDITNNNGVGQTAYISLPKAGVNKDGYLSSADWNRFNSYETGLAVQYVSNVTSSNKGYYQIGNIKIGGNDNIVYGINNISALTLENGSTSGTNQNYNPILRFTETGVTTDYDITLEGTRGIIIQKNGKKVEFRVNNVVASGSSKYLQINSSTGEFEVLIGSDNGDTVTPGLTDYEEFIQFQNVVAHRFNNLYYEIENSLHDTTQTYYYGSTALKAVVAPEGFEI